MQNEDYLYDVEQWGTIEKRMFQKCEICMTMLHSFKCSSASSDEPAELTSMLFFSHLHFICLTPEKANQKTNEVPLLNFDLPLSPHPRPIRGLAWISLFLK